MPTKDGSIWPLPALPQKTLTLLFIFYFFSSSLSLGMKQKKCQTVKEEKEEKEEERRGKMRKMRRKERRKRKKKRQVFFYRLLTSMYKVGGWRDQKLARRGRGVYSHTFLLLYLYICWLYPSGLRCRFGKGDIYFYVGRIYMYIGPGRLGSFLFPADIMISLLVNSTLYRLRHHQS